LELSKNLKNIYLPGHAKKNPNESFSSTIASLFSIRV
jgi:hypothetical protein